MNDDEMVEKAAREEAERRYGPPPGVYVSTFERAAFVAGAQFALDAAGVDALRAEVERLRAWQREVCDVGFGYDADEPGAAEEVLTFLPAWKGAHGGTTLALDEARQQVAYLRARIEALLDGAYIRGWELTVRADDLRAALAEGGQPDDAKHGPACNDGLRYQDGPPYRCEGECRPAPVVHNHGTEDGPGLSCPETRLPDGSLRGSCVAPVVPDSPDTPICGSVGPRIGAEGRPRCGQTLDHDGPHRGFPGSGFESQTWGGPLWRDDEWAAEYAVLHPTRQDVR